MVYDVICDEYELICSWFMEKTWKNAKNAIGNRSFFATLSENERVGERGKVIEYI